MNKARNVYTAAAFFAIRRSRMAALLIAALLLCLGGCGKSQKRGGVQQNMDNLNLTGLPIVKEKESFTLFADNSTNPPQTMFDFFETATNVHANLMLYPTHVARERKNILIAGGDYPDVMGGWLLYDSDIISLAGDGVIIPLEELIDQYTVNIKEALNIPGVREQMTLPDGHIYSPPYVIEEPLVTFHPWINVKWLKQLGLKMPETTEEFKNTLIAFRDRIPPVNGQKIIPFSWDPYQHNMGILAGWFGINAADYFAIIDGRLEIAVTRPEFKAYLKYFADLYAGGLVDPEFFTQDKPAWQAKGRQGLYGAAYCYWPDDFAPRISTDATVNQWDYEALPVLRAPGVEKPVYRRNCYGVNIFRSQFVITDKAANPITIIRWLDYNYGELQSLEAKYGPIGIKVEQLPDGRYREIDVSAWTDAQKEQFENQYSYVWSLPKYFRPGHKVLPPEGKRPEYDPKITSDALYEPYLEPEKVPRVWLDKAASRQISVLRQPIDYYFKQKTAEWISGQSSIDAEWDAYIAQLERLKIEELLQLTREAMNKRGGKQY